MSKAIWSAGHLKPDVRLAQAVSVFEASLSSDEKARLRSSRSQSQSKAPTIDDVMRFTAEVDARARSLLGSGRCFGPRLTYLLQTVQQFAALGDILIGGSQNLIACGVWSVVRMAIMAVTVSASTTERLSLLFMTAGKSAPRYQQLALLYAKSRHIRDYLAEYLIIIVQMCHYFHDFSRKSTIGQITSSLSDAKIRNAEEELSRWGQLIKDEAGLLLVQTTQDEATENSKSRKWLSRSVDSISHQQNIDRRLKWLTAFSTFDHETPWKQVRKRGSSTFFVDMAGYKQWKEKQGPQGLLLSGKMGCGKSVTMANMVDDLYLSCRQDTVIYFFCRYDIPESLKPRTIFGSLAAQITQRYLDTDVMDGVFVKAVSLMSLDKILSILPWMIRQTNGVRLVLDGIDECSEEEVDVICSCLQHLQRSCSIFFCVSYRDQAEGIQAKLLGTGQIPILSVPDNNPDIREFIDSELQKMRESRKLSIGNPKLLITIRETLLQGADGMFLWVALQMDAICAERTDDAIQQALDNLPKGLSATFRRILASSKQEEGRCYQKDILKILVGANRPLVVDEFREALSVTPGDTVWDPRKLINNIQSTLACCGSLVVIDEEEGTVRLLHQSVAQFLQVITPDSTQWSFTSQDANSRLGDITVTYLNYGVFDRQLSTQVIPRIDASEAPDKIIAQTFRPLGAMAQKLAYTRLIPQRSAKRDIGEVLFKVSSSRQNITPTEGVFHLLAYSSENWLSHTSSMSYCSPRVRLFERLLSNPQFTPCSAYEDGSFDFLASQKRDSLSREVDRHEAISRLSKEYSMNRMNALRRWDRILNASASTQMKWAILNSHSLILSMELRSGSGIGAFSSVVSFLHDLMENDMELKLAPHMCDKLLLIAISLRAAQTTKWLINTLGYSLDRYLKLLREYNNFEYATLRWTVVHQFFDLHNLQEPWVELAVAHGDAQAVRSILRKGASLNIFATKSPLQSAMRSCLSQPENLLMTSYMLESAELSDIFSTSLPDVIGFFSAFAHHGNIYRDRNTNSTTTFVFDHWFKFGRTPNSNRIKLAILTRACERGDLRLVQLMTDVLRSLKDREISALILDALFARSNERTQIVIEILCARQFRTKLREELYLPALVRSVQLRDWRSAFAIAEPTPFPGVSPFMVDRGLLYTCIDSRDLDGLCFLLSHTIPHDVEGWPASPASLIGTQHNIDTPFHYATMTKWESLEDCCELFKVILCLKRMHLHLPDAAKRTWALQDYIELIMGLFQRVLSFLIKDNKDSEGNTDLAALSRSKSSLLYHLDVFLENMSDSNLTEELWRGAFTAILEGYQYTTTLLHRIRDRKLTSPSNLALVENTNVLKLGIVRMAETLMRVRAALERRRVLARAMSAPHWCALDGYMDKWQVDGVMGLVLWKYYSTRDVYQGKVDWQVEIRDPIQETYMPLGWEVCAIGTKATDILEVCGDSMNHLRAAELSLFRTKWSEETRMANTILAWRAVTRRKPSVEGRAELPS